MVPRPDGPAPQEGLGPSGRDLHSARRRSPAAARGGGSEASSTWSSTCTGCGASPRRLGGPGGSSWAGHGFPCSPSPASLRASGPPIVRRIVRSFPRWRTRSVSSRAAGAGGGYAWAGIGGRARGRSLPVNTDRRRAPRLTSLVVGFLLPFSAAGVARAAEITGSIAGVVKDGSGVVLPGATVTLRGGSLPAQGRVASVAPSGSYRLALLQPGRYDVEARLQGFGPQVRKGVEVFLDSEIRLDFVLKPANIEETIEVIGETPLVDARKSEVFKPHHAAGHRLRSPFERPRVRGPREARPGDTPVTGGAPGGDLNDISIFGERAAALSFLVDGADNNNPLSGGPFVRYTQDSIKEFEVVTTGYEAQYGRAQGGVTNIITRSGANELQGSAFVFGRDDSLDSSNVEGQDAPTLRRYQWGASLGGPIKRDKAFFFGTFEVLNEDPRQHRSVEDPGVRRERPRHARRHGELRRGAKHPQAQRPREVRREPGLEAAPAGAGEPQRPGRLGRDRLSHPRDHSPAERRLGRHRDGQLRDRPPYRFPQLHDVPGERRHLPEGPHRQQPRSHGTLRADPHPAGERLPADGGALQRQTGPHERALPVGPEPPPGPRRAGEGTTSSRPDGTSPKRVSRGSTTSSTTSSTPRPSCPPTRKPSTPNALPRSGSPSPRRASSSPSPRSGRT